MSEKKTSEWWIKQGYVGIESGTKYPSQISNTKLEDFVHVIEYSAYEEQKQANAELYKTHCSFAEVNDLLNKQNAELRALVKSFEKQSGWVVLDLRLKT